MEAVMKKATFLSIAVLVNLVLAPNSQGATMVFKNCTELNKVYPGGVALPGAINIGGSTKLTPKFDKKLYEANKKSDRDNDGIACEK